MPSGVDPSALDRNKEIVSRYLNEFWSKGNVAIVDELCSDDFVGDYPLHGRRVGKREVKRMRYEFREAFPNVSFHPFGPIPMIAEENYVVIRWIGGGKHTGTAFDDLPLGRIEQANTGKEIQFSGTTIYSLKDGKIVEEVCEEGALMVLQQLGIITRASPANQGPESRPR